jgi:uncharacterized protein (DUF486 family)
MQVQQIALFLQTTKFMENDTIIQKLISNQFWATIFWALAIPAIRIGYAIMGPMMLNMSSYLFLFSIQIINNVTWLNHNNTIDDYLSILLVLIGMGISTYKIFG